MKKKDYLKMFQQAELLLDSDYEHYAADEVSLGIAAQLNSSVERRRRNAQMLMDSLQKSSIATPFFSSLNDADVPLVVPVAVKKGKRDALRRYLIDNRIYCPIHWPISKLHDKITSDERELYDVELSLICDQRYSGADMDYQMSVIKRFE